VGELDSKFTRRTIRPGIVFAPPVNLAPLLKCKALELLSITGDQQFPFDITVLNRMQRVETLELERGLVTHAFLSCLASALQQGTAILMHADSLIVQRA
jgi:hypothetical protein